MKPGTYKGLEGKDFTVTSLGSWKSPHTSIKYPQGWAIKVPSIGLDAKVSAVLADQEFYKSFGTPIYWEGLCDLGGTRQGKAVTGHAYVELTGYKK